jgi:glycosyltransferase involved in cell wall biosynthesis
LAQTFTDYEFIVVDDGSTDRTGNNSILWCKDQKHTSGEPGIGNGYKPGFLMRMASMAFLDSDDYFFPIALAAYDKIISALDSPPMIIGAMQRFVQNEDVKIDPGSLNGDIEVFKYRDYLSKDMSIGMAQSRIVMKKALFEKAQKDTGIPRARNMNDYRLVLRAGIYGPCVIASRPITLAYRHHENQSSKNIEKMCQGVLYLIDMVRYGQTAAGRSRRFDRYSYLGGIINEWSGKAYKSKLNVLASKS